MDVGCAGGAGATVGAGAAVEVGPSRIGVRVGVSALVVAGTAGAHPAKATIAITTDILRK